MGSVLCMVNLGEHLGSWDRAHLQRWVHAQNAARRSRPTCDAVLKDGRRCRGDRLRNQCFCRHHLPRQLRAAAQEERELRARRIIAGGAPPCILERAYRTLRTAGKRRLHSTWLQFPETPGSTIEWRSEADRLRCVEWLKAACDLDIDKPIAATGKMLTCRALDRVYWAAWRVVRSPDAASDVFIEKAKQRVNAALIADAKYWAHVAAADAADAADEEALP